MKKAVILLGLCSIQQNKWVKSGEVLKMKAFHVQWLLMLLFNVILPYFLILFCKKKKNGGAKLWDQECLTSYELTKGCVNLLQL